MLAFQLHEPDLIPSPSLLFAAPTIRNNLKRMLALAGSPDLLRPHMKTHKTREITKLYLEHGVTRHKCATLAEAKILAECGAPDVLIAYPMVGPNQQLLCRLAKQHPGTRFSVLAEDPNTVLDLSTAAGVAGVQIGLYLDVNVGHNRTGLGKFAAAELAAGLLGKSLATEVRGLHLYDGHNIAVDARERDALARATLDQGLKLRERLGGPERLELVFGGTPGFLYYAQHTQEPNITLSPGTCVLHDVGYCKKYPELGFTPAAAVLTRCVSKPGPKLATFDVGTKAICSDPPAGERCVLLGLEHAKAVLHNEEHLVLEGDEAAAWERGKATYAMPAHVCPTVAMYDSAFVVERGKVIDEWEIAARGRLQPLE